MAEQHDTQINRLEIRIDELESRLLFSDDTIASLNEALVDQQSRVAELERSVTLLVKQLRDSHQQMDESDDQPPPHY